MIKTQVNDIISSGLEVRGLELLDKRPSVGSLSNTNELSTDEMYQFLMNSKNILESLIAGCEEFPGKFLAPQSENIQLNEQIYDLLIKYYEDTYVNSIFKKPFMQEIFNLVIVLNKTNQYKRC